MSCAKMAELIEMPLGMWTRLGSRKRVSHEVAHWRHLANTIKPSVRLWQCGLMSDYLDHMLCYW